MIVNGSCQLVCCICNPAMLKHIISINKDKLLNLNKLSKSAEQDSVETAWIDHICRALVNNIFPLNNYNPLIPDSIVNQLLPDAICRSQGFQIIYWSSIIITNTITDDDDNIIADYKLSTIYV